MKIVLTDAYSVNPGDLSWELLRPYGECTVYDRTAPGEVVARCRDAEAVLTNKVVFDAATLDALPNLIYIGVLATGYNVVDVAAAARRGIVVTNIPAYSTLSVAQMVFAHLLHITHNVSGYAKESRNGRWSANPDFCYWNEPLIELSRLKMGLVGYGSIGKAVATIAQSFGMQVLVHSRQNRENIPSAIESVPLERLFSESDVVSLHCRLSEETAGMINSGRLNSMKSTAILINTGRGGLVNEEDLAQALNQGTIHAAGLDVLSSEPPGYKNPLLTARNCFITPHIAWATRAARERLIRIAAENLREYCEGLPLRNQITS